MDKNPPWVEIGRCALAAPTRDAFRSEVLRHLLVWVGGDGGFIQRIAPQHGVLADATLHEQDPQLIARCGDGWITHYSGELTSIFAVIAKHGAALDTHVIDKRRRRRSVFYADIMAPQRVREAIFGSFGILDGELTGMSLMRRSDRVRPLDNQSLEIVRSVVPVIAIAEALLAKRPRRLDHDVEIARLTKREREVVELVTLGYTNAEIALALGSSAFTVRNQLTSIYRKAGATTRAELVGLTFRALQ